MISPSTAAMDIVNRHLTIIECDLAAPQIHAEAMLNPKMRGGPSWILAEEDWRRYQPNLTLVT